jgi:YgiT-type zinc finger domain-containing protein
MGETRPGSVTVTLDRGKTTVIVKEVPAEVCEICGEYYLSEPVTDWISDRAESAVERGAEVEILRYAA